MKSFLFTALLAVLVGAALAQDEPPPPSKEKSRPDKDGVPSDMKAARERAENLEKMMRAIEERVGARLADARREAAARQPGLLLARTVRLEIRQEPGGPEERPLVLRTATDRFTIGVGLKGRGQGMNMKISGQIQLLDNNQILVTYDANMDFAGDQGGGNVAVSGGVKLLPGRPTTVATLGERHLVLVATYDEEPAAAADNK